MKSRILWIVLGFVAIASLAAGIFLPLLRSDIEASSPQAKSDAKTIARALARDEKRMTLPENLNVNFIRQKDEWIGRALVTDADVISLAKAEEVDVVKMKFPELTAKGVLALENEPITSIDLFRPIMDFEAMEALSKLKTLENLCISGSRSLDDKLFLHLSGPPGLRRLNVRDTGITDEFIVHVVQVYPDLEKINLRKCKRVTTLAIETLRSMKKLKAVNLSNVIVDRAGVTSLSKFKHLATLQMVETGFGDSFFNELRNSEIVVFDVSENAIGDAGLLLAAKMPKLKKLIAMRCPNLTESGIKKFARLRPDVKLVVAKGKNKKKEQSNSNTKDLLF